MKERYKNENLNENLSAQGGNEGENEVFKSAQNILIKTAQNALSCSRNYYKSTSILEIKTGDKSMDHLLKWLPYQTLSCRFYARAGFYQAGGAFGFRDQLQDCMALLYYSPQLVRDHILECAAHQFEEGDVQHWWHAPRMGVRTRITDDMLYLPWAVSEYVKITGDREILHETVPFLKGRKLREGERDAYFSPEIGEMGTIYQHCLRALLYNNIADNNLVFMGGGDWNDAMDRVGSDGKGTSVFNSMFTFYVINRFCSIVDDLAIKRKLLSIAKRLKMGVHDAWDGGWFLRAFMDDGRVLGSRRSEECKIDLLTQAWASLSGIVDSNGIDGGKGKLASSVDETDCIFTKIYNNEENSGQACESEKCNGSDASARGLIAKAENTDDGSVFVNGKRCVKTALKSAADRLVDYQNGIIKLLDPPFNHIRAGYISEYPKGIRENGGQYTHAAVWFIMALLKEGCVDYAFSLLEMLNPINHSKTTDAKKRYMTEPYVLCGDVYSGAFAGCGGWSWYTGAAGWYYKCIVENVIGLDLRAGKLGFFPRLPQKIKSVDIGFKTDFGTLDITIDNTGEGNWTLFVGKVRYNISYILISPSLLGKKITIKKA